MKHLVYLFLLLTISCGGSSGDSTGDSSEKGSGDETTGSTVFPNSLFFKGCVDAACAESKIFQANLESKTLSSVAELEYTDNFSGSNSTIYINNKVYFTAQVPGGGDNHLWVFDPSSAILADVNPKNISLEAVGAQDFIPGEFTAVGNKLYFSATTAAEGKELWLFDTELIASASNPSLVYDLNPGVDSSDPENIIHHNNKLYFRAKDAISGIEFRILDTQVTASASNPQVADILTGASNGVPGNISLLGDKIYFSAFDGTNGVETWVFDTTLALSGSNPALEIDLILGAGSSFPAEFTLLGGKVYFTATDAINGLELWAYDPAVAQGVGNPLVVDIISGASGSGIREVKAIGSTLYFNVLNSAGNGDELWSYDTTVAVSGSNPGELLDLEVGASSSSPDLMFAYGGKLLFSATESIYGTEIWLFDTSLPINIGVNPSVFDGVSGASNNTIESAALSF